MGEREWESERERESSVILEATPPLGTSLRKMGGEWLTRRPATQMMDPGSELGQSRLRHFAVDRVADEKIMERDVLALDNRNASGARAFQKENDDLVDQRLVDYWTTQVRTNGAWKHAATRKKEKGT